MTTGIRVTLAFALMVYPFLVLLNLIVSTSGDTLDVFLTGFGSFLLWFNLCIALLLTAIHDGIPWWSSVLAVLVLPFFLFSAVSVPDLLKDGQPVRWMTVVPILGPLLLFVYVVWATFPVIRALVSPNVASSIVWGALSVLAVIPARRSMDLSQLRQARDKESQAPMKARRQQFEQVPVDAPIADFFPFLVYPETDEDAQRRIRTSKRKQSDMELMLNSGDYRFFQRTDQLDLIATPRLCEGGQKWLRDKLDVAARGDDEAQYRMVAYNELYVDVLLWFANNKCAFDRIDEYEKLLRSYPDADAQYLQSTFTTLEKIKRKQQTP
jgi:hypothetical protein